MVPPAAAARAQAETGAPAPLTQPQTREGRPHRAAFVVPGGQKPPPQSEPDELLLDESHELELDEDEEPESPPYVVDQVLVSAGREVLEPVRLSRRLRSLLFVMLPACCQLLPSSEEPAGSMANPDVRRSRWATARRRWGRRAAPRAYGRKRGGPGERTGAVAQPGAASPPTPARRPIYGG